MSAGGGETRQPPEIRCPYCGTAHEKTNEYAHLGEEQPEEVLACRSCGRAYVVHCELLRIYSVRRIHPRR